MLGNCNFSLRTSNRAFDFLWNLFAGQERGFAPLLPDWIGWFTDPEGNRVELWQPVATD
jgi:hypothetical protein